MIFSGDSFKTLLLLVVLSFAGYLLYSAEPQKNAADRVSTDFLLNEDFDALDEMFESSGAVVEAVKTEPEKTAINKVVENFFIPLSFSGHMEGSVGIFDRFSSREQKGYGGIIFDNYLYMTARADKNMGIKGTILTSIPNLTMNVYELYFDYLLLDRVYITAGKKSTTWGYVRIFSDSGDFLKKDINHSNEDVLLTNILYDSLNNISCLIRVPLWTGTVSGLAMCPTSADINTLDFDSLVFAGSVEMTVLHTSLNLFARKNPKKTEPTAADRPKLGFEIKRTILGADVYGQAICNVVDWKHMFGSGGIAQIVSTCGLYKWWDTDYPNIGFNIEAQDVYYKESSAHKMALAFDGGVKQRFFGKVWKFGVTVRHTLFDQTRDTRNYGTASFAINVSGLLPHADWENGLQIEYGEKPWDFKVPRFTIGTRIKLTLDY